MPTDQPPLEHLIESAFQSDPAMYPPNPSSSWGAQGPPSSRGAYSGVSVASRVSLSSQIWRTNFKDVLAALPTSPKRTSANLPPPLPPLCPGSNGTQTVPSPAGSPQKRPRQPRPAAVLPMWPRPQAAAADGMRAAQRADARADELAQRWAGAAGGMAYGGRGDAAGGTGGRRPRRSQNAARPDKRFQMFDGISADCDSDAMSDGSSGLPVRVSAAHIAQHLPSSSSGTRQVRLLFADVQPRIHTVTLMRPRERIVCMHSL